MRVRIYVEGGGNSGSSKAACREAFLKLFQKLSNLERNPRVIASGGRLKAFQNFCDALENGTDEVILLLVDAERPVTASAWHHLSAPPDNWGKPPAATDGQAHLMVQSMEAWFIADKEAVTRYYGRGFRVNSLPRRQTSRTFSKMTLCPLWSVPRETQRRVGTIRPDMRTRSSRSSVPQKFDKVLRTRNVFSRCSRKRLRAMSPGRSSPESLFPVSFSCRCLPSLRCRRAGWRSPHIACLRRQGLHLILQAAWACP